MESRFRHDFSRVRIHADGPAHASAAALQAQAYTVGPHIAFARGAHDPATDAGKRLVAHELAHVVQQSGAHGSVRRGRGGARGRTDRRLSRSRTPRGSGAIDSGTDRAAARGRARRARARGGGRRGRRQVVRPLPDRGADGRLLVVAREQPREHGLHARPRRVGRLRGQEAEVGQAPLRDLPERGDRASARCSASSASIRAGATSR